MTIKDAIAQLERHARSLPSGLNAEFKLVQIDEADGASRELVADPDSERWDFEILRGEDEAVVEFRF